MMKQATAVNLAAYYSDIPLHICSVC